MSKHKDERKEFVRRLFGKEPDAEPAPADRLHGNHVPNEGENPSPAPDKDAEMRQFTRDLFDNA